MKKGKTVALPKVLGNEIRFFEVKNLEKDLAAGTFKILEPNENCREILFSEVPKIVVVPGIVFDKFGNRIGFGKGFYDKFLCKIPASTAKVAFAFDCQIVEKIVPAPLDVAVDYVISPNLGVFKTLKSAPEKV